MEKEKRTNKQLGDNRPVNCGFLNQTRIVRPHWRPHHLLNMIIGELRQGGPQLRDSIRLKLGLPAEKLSDIDVSEASLLCYLVVRFSRWALRVVQLADYGGSATLFHFNGAFSISLCNGRKKMDGWRIVATWRLLVIYIVFWKINYGFTPTVGS